MLKKVNFIITKFGVDNCAANQMTNEQKLYPTHTFVYTFSIYIY